jgi:hypothetical protein
MKGEYFGVRWQLTRRKDLDIIGDTGKTYIFTANNGKQDFRESVVYRYCPYYRKPMYDNSFSSAKFSSQKKLAKYLCSLFRASRN